MKVHPAVLESFHITDKWMDEQTSESSSCS
jgi:hypothetical protein